LTLENQNLAFKAVGITAPRKILLKNYSKDRYLTNLFRKFKENRVVRKEIRKFKNINLTKI